MACVYWGSVRRICSRCESGSAHLDSLLQILRTDPRSRLDLGDDLARRPAVAPPDLLNRPTGVDQGCRQAVGEGAALGLSIDGKGSNQTVDFLRLTGHEL